MTKPTRIIRAPHDSDWVTTSRLTPQDESLTWEARGVLWYLLSKPSSWVVQPKDLQQNCGRDKVYTILNELVEKCYIRYIEERKDGRFLGITYMVYERPYAEKPDTEMPRKRRVTTRKRDTPPSEKPDTVKPDTEKSDTENADIRNIETPEDERVLESEEKEKNSTPPDKPAVNNREPNPMYDAVFDIFKLTAGMNTDLCKMLEGKATKKGYIEYNLLEPIDAAGLREWGDWYRRTELGGDPNLSMVKKRDKIQSSIGYWQAKKKEREARRAAAQAAAEANDANMQSGSYSPCSAEPDGSKPTPETTPLPEDRKAAAETIIRNTAAKWGVKRAQSA